MARADPIDTKTLKAALARSDSCATVEELLGLSAGSGAGPADPRVSEHVARCVRCRAELALLKDFDETAPRPDEEVAVRWIVERLDRDVARMTGAAPAPLQRDRGEETRRRWRPRAALRPVAAGLALAAAMLLLVLNLRGRDGVRPPALSPDLGEGPAVFRSNAVTLLAPADDLDERPTELRWEGVAAAASYSVRVMEVDRTDVWKTEARQPSVSLPASVRARIVPGKPLLWQVEAKDAAGTVIATSQVRRFRLRLPHEVR